MEKRNNRKKEKNRLKERKEAIGEEGKDNRMGGNEQ